MIKLSDEKLVDVIKQRASVRKYKKGMEIPEEILQQIIELTTTAPSSWNLQHWKFIVVQKDEYKEKLFTISYKQQQVLDSSAVIVVLGDLEANRNAERVYSEAVHAGYMSEEAKNKLVSHIENAYQTIENIGVHEAIRNASLAAMQLMLVAKSFGLDTCPMGGFDAKALQKEFNVPQRYIPVLLLSLGYAAEPAHETSRFPVEEVMIKETF